MSEPELNEVVVRYKIAESVKDYTLDKSLDNDCIFFLRKHGYELIGGGVERGTRIREMRFAKS